MRDSQCTSQNSSSHLELMNKLWSWRIMGLDTWPCWCIICVFPIQSVCNKPWRKILWIVASGTQQLDATAQKWHESKYLITRTKTISIPGCKFNSQTLSIYDFPNLFGSTIDSPFFGRNYIVSSAPNHHGFSQPLVLVSQNCPLGPMFFGLHINLPI